jgi:hypothetical protein
MKYIYEIYEWNDPQRAINYLRPIKFVLMNEEMEEEPFRKKYKVSNFNGVRKITIKEFQNMRKAKLKELKPFEEIS